ncbi:MAG: acyl-CoA dehydratase activase-related protein [Chloroflexi bacterium]|nr:acyl-CoA dehydratase activase-related protein [Chloroflexota bacterium]
MRVGIPRALHYFRYYPLAKAFLEALDVEIVLSEPTNRAIMARGLDCAVAETCLPIKAYFGHVLELRDKVDYVLVPSVRSVEPNLYNCVKLFALPDMVRGAIRDHPPLLDFCFDINLGKGAVLKEIFSVGKRLGADKRRTEAAMEAGLALQKRYDSALARGLMPIEAIKRLDNGANGDEGSRSNGHGDKGPRVAVLGHPYNVYDDYLVHGLVGKLRGLGAEVVTAEAASKAELDAGVQQVIGEPYWMTEREITGAAGHYLTSDEVDGVIAVTAFGCGPDSLMIDAVQRTVNRSRCHPLLSLNIDEHTADAGLITRLEAFVDSLKRVKASEARLNKAPLTLIRHSSGISEPIKITFPHMGTVHVPVQVAFNRLGMDLVVPPPCSKRSLEMASKYSPEWACIPYKLILGNYIEALEMGANTLLLLRGPNNCRFGYYHKLQEQVLRDLGYKFQLGLPEIQGRAVKGMIKIVQDLSGASWRDCFATVQMALAVLRDVDEIERKVQYVRAREVRPGLATRIWQEALDQIGQVTTRGELKRMKKKFLTDLDNVPMDRGKVPIKICVVGEIYVVQEPYINQDVEIELGKLGVEANRSEQVSQWLTLGPQLFLQMFGLGHSARIRRAEKPYLQYWSGETLGQTAMAHEDGYDGVVHLAPFTCTPEVVAQNILPKLRRNVDVPVLSLILDEQTGRAGFITRLEAFVDFLERRKQGHGKSAPGRRLFGIPSR